MLQHLIPSITFIQAELDKGRGILVHCQAGTSACPRIYLSRDLLCKPGRSATIAAAYLMYSQNVDAGTAIDLIRKARPTIKYVPFAPSLFLFNSPSPNAGFMAQLEVFHQASYKVSRRDKATRMFYLERAVEEILSNIIYPRCILTCCMLSAS